MLRHVNELPGRTTHATDDELRSADNAHPAYVAGALLSEVAPRVVREDAWEQPRSPQASAPVAREPAVGDRIIIQQGRRPIPALVNQIGTVVEIFRAPRDSCLVRIDGDTDSQREWFCYQDEIALYPK